ncbi:hypothetical protein AGMMS49960_11180 [Betaproteobacteria bacterium]|nr:hypothetical protein AGMMS49543_08930 [Betaproteobacteria bacterium]GHU01278.1 hypothetical protein AGMMS49960_11180 [Betaproteobacteria bacterium]GHU17243.1 hypothetical protein AGMMS50243_05130 [Betaproteobacteria bacterium]
MITYDESKRLLNIADHDIDLAGVESVFDFPMHTWEDDTEAYGEQRLRSLCWLHDRVVYLVWTDRGSSAHVISCREGSKHETKKYQEFALR